MSAPAWEALVERALSLTEPAAHLSSYLRDQLGNEGMLHTLPAGPRPDPGKAAYTDGAVAAEQTDALVWIAASGVAHGGPSGTIEHTAAAVAPVTGETERARSAIMATCELAAATDATRAGAPIVFMDGGLATPLVSVAMGMLAHDPDVHSAVEHHYATVDLACHVDRYVTDLLNGKIAALPKQDTARSYADIWGTRYRATLSADQQAVLDRTRDRPLLNALLRPGEWITPRRATFTTVEAKQPGPDGIPAALDAHYASLRQASDLYVTYVAPRRLPGHVIKLEYREAHPGDWTTAQRLLGHIDTATVGPRVREPLGQHLADDAAKRVVTGTLASLMGYAEQAAPQAAERYRTVR